MDLKREFPPITAEKEHKTFQEMTGMPESIKKHEAKLYDIMQKRKEEERKKAREARLRALRKARHTSYQIPKVGTTVGVKG